MIKSEGKSFLQYAELTKNQDAYIYEVQPPSGLISHLSIPRVKLGAIRVQPTLWVVKPIAIRSLDIHSFLL